MALRICFLYLSADHGSSLSWSLSAGLFFLHRCQPAPLSFHFQLVAVRVPRALLLGVVLLQACCVHSCVFLPAEGSEEATPPTSPTPPACACPAVHCHSRGDPRQTVGLERLLVKTVLPGTHISLLTTTLSSSRGPVPSSGPFEHLHTHGIYS